MEALANFVEIPTSLTIGENMPTINTNVDALFAQNASTVNSRSMSTAMQQLSTGSRINSAKDDAAGLGISQNTREGREGERKT